MCIEKIINILEAFSRYLEFINRNGFDEMIMNLQVKNATLILTLKGHQGEKYALEVWISDTTKELCIENAITHESVFNYAAEHNIGNADINDIKFGLMS